MSARTKLKRALQAIDDAKDVLRRAAAQAEVAAEVRRALNELEDAENYVRRAIRDLPDE